MVFPFKEGTQAPLVGNSVNPVRLTDWQDYIGAVVWSVDLSLQGNWDLTTIAELEATEERDADASPPTAGSQVCTFVERTMTRWEEMESGGWQVTQKPESVELLNVDSGRVVTFGFTQPPSPAREGQEIPFELRCTAPAGFEEQGAIGKHWQTTQAQASFHLEGLGGGSLSCQADNSYPNGHNDAVVRLAPARDQQVLGRRELAKLQVKAVVGNDYYYLFFGWWYECR